MVDATPVQIRGNTKTTREEWLQAARDVLVAEGAAHIKIDRLARGLGVTRGGFYWFFRNRQDLLDQLLADWKSSRSDRVFQTLKEPFSDPIDLFVRFTVALVNEREYSPALDSAVRDWARTSVRAKKAVTLVDDRRIKLLTDAFKQLGYSGEDAFIRARVFYFHQVGYYAMELRETREERLHYLPVYFKVLTGFDLPAEQLEKIAAEL